MDLEINCTTEDLERRVKSNPISSLFVTGVSMYFLYKISPLTVVDNAFEYIRDKYANYID